MAEKIFEAQSNYGWGLSLNMTGKAPAIAKRIWNTYADALAYVNNFNDSAIEGLQLSVVADNDPKKNGVYFVEKAGTFTETEVEGSKVKVANNDGSLVKVGGTETEVAAKYSEAVTLSNNLVVGQLIKVSTEETIDGATYKSGFYIVNAPGSISALDTSTGSSDEIGALSNRVTTLEGNRVLVSDFNTYKSEVSGALDAKASLTDFNTHVNNANIHVTVEDKAKWNNAEENAKGYAAEEIAKLANVYEAKGTAASAIAALDLPNTYDAKGAAATAESNAKSHADTEIGKLDTKAQGYASAAESNAKSHADAEIGKLDTKAQGYASAAQTAAEGHADSLNTAMDTRVKALEDHKDDYKAYADQAETDAIAAAKSETESQVGSMASTLRGEMATDLQTAKDYADDAVEVAVGAYTAEGVTASGLRKEIEDKVNAVSAAAKTYSISKVSTDLSENVREAYKLVDEKGVQVGDLIEIYKDSALQKVELNGQSLEFTYILANGTTQMVPVDVSSFLSEAEHGNGLQVIDHVISVKVDAASESFLTVGENGIKLAGVQSAIDTAAGNAKSGAEATAKSYTDAREVEIDKKWAAADVTLKTNLEAYADQAEADAITEAGKLVNALANGAVKDNTDAIAVLNGGINDAGSVAKAAEDAKAAAIAKAAEDAAKMLENYYTKAETEAAIKVVADDLAELEGNLKDAAYTTVAALESTMDSKDNAVKELVQDVADDLAELEGKLGDAAYTTVAALESTMDSKDSAIDTKAQGYASAAQTAAEGYAKTYTDLLFTSFQFAQNSDIDTLFATATA